MKKLEKQKVPFRLAYYTFICCLWDRKEIKMMENVKNEEMWESREKGVLA